MYSFLEKDRWPSYVVGALIGILLTAIFVTGHQLGVSSSIARVGALIEHAISPSQITEGSYFAHLLANHTIFDWKIVFIIGLLLGSWIATILSKEPAPPKNTFWINRFGPSKSKRYLGAFIGGFLLMLGARLANGCTSGHAISGGAQLSAVSWIFMITLFITAIPVSMLIYKNKH